MVSLQSDLRISTAGNISKLSEINTYKTRKTKKGFMSTVVNRAFSSLHGGSLKITLTVPFIFTGQLCNSLTKLQMNPILIFKPILGQHLLFI